MFLMLTGNVLYTTIKFVVPPCFLEEKLKTNSVMDNLREGCPVIPIGVAAIVVTAIAVPTIFWILDNVARVFAVIW